MLEPKNLFYSYIKRTGDREVADFLITAKRLEKVRDDMTSPWYYPSSRQIDPESEVGKILATCKAYRGSRLADRYALQGVRALFAAQGYVAGCYTNLGEKVKADSVSSLCGDYLAINPKDRVPFVAQMNPNAAALIGMVSELAVDSVRFAEAIPLIGQLARSKAVKHKGDWELALAYYYGEYAGDLAQARRHIQRAMSGSMSGKDVADQARLYRAKLDARVGDASRMAADMRWMVDNNYKMHSENIIYENWIPTLWKRGDYASAILLCGYADSGEMSAGELADMRASETAFNYEDFGSLSFQLMGSLTSGQLIQTVARLNAPGQLSFLRKFLRPDADYYNELIGTLALREENYDRAVAYLSKVSDKYLKTMNIVKCGYLARDPFVDHRAKGDGERAKLNFARKMLELRRQMVSAPTADQRAMAKLKYEVAYHNSFENCWALTRYYDGFCSNVFVPLFRMWGDDEPEPDYSFLFTYEPTSRKAIDNEYRYRSAIPAALMAMSSDEARAESEYYLGNVRTVVKRYPDTSTASFVKSSCDGWRWWY